MSSINTSANTTIRYESPSPDQRIDSTQQQQQTPEDLRKLRRRLNAASRLNVANKESQEASPPAPQGAWLENTNKSSSEKTQPQPLHPDIVHNNPAAKPGPSISPPPSPKVTSSLGSNDISGEQLSPDKEQANSIITSPNNPQGKHSLEEIARIVKRARELGLHIHNDPPPPHRPLINHAQPTKSELTRQISYGGLGTICGMIANGAGLYIFFNHDNTSSAANTHNAAASWLIFGIKFTLLFTALVCYVFSLPRLAKAIYDWHGGNYREDIKESASTRSSATLPQHTTGPDNV